ncbi:Phosphatidate cytidylyltransferase [Candidatus Westeberhardia cardiocondylae]|uniref:Phosphatidate cytidylyltransferase n=1 Tax=Candidatus Westeberhardia cardiocondylae TaxID=1594731 RepID=A0A0H5BX56_9ENTR|nr:phosphatidate cytidylyltransferase [Candidatus Westeberhardia cardiocondylae]MCR3756297.1 CDP-diglyceride synthetase [Candidatus Westeberhardia cardiocondylae]CEN32288.1 Phosphatidate cytidylyltransferase [Candidatus Westeberhardia cardiocondylae]
MIKNRIISTIFLTPIVIGIISMFTIEKLIIFLFILNIFSIFEWNKFIIPLLLWQRILFLIFYFTIIVIIILITVYEPYFLLKHKIKYIFIPITLSWWITASLLILFYPYSTKLWNNSKILKMLFGMFIIIPFFWSILILQQEQHTYNYDHSMNTWKILYVIILIWGLDSSSYIFGKLLGKHKLIPKISPNKTWEGTIGGLTTSYIIHVIFIKYTILYNISHTKLNICFIIIIISAILGDLNMSMFKRVINIKDSGNLIPGHGGILDRIDSLSSAVPIFTCLTLLMNF